MPNSSGSSGVWDSKVCALFPVMAGIVTEVCLAYPVVGA
jgi:hypothetical protein